MADCLNVGGSEPKFTTMGTEQMNSSAAAPTRPRRNFGIILYFVLLTAIAIIAFILGIYSTDKVNSINVSQPDAVLVSDPSQAPAGYTAYSLGTGLGYWGSSAPMTYTRSDHGVISDGKYAYLIGGLSNVDPATNRTSENATVLQQVIKYDTETGYMTRMADMPAKRYRFAYARVGDKIFVMGGTDIPDGDATDTTFVYDMKADNWTTGPRLHEPRIDACGAAVGDAVYVFGGYDPANGFTSRASVEKYMPAWGTPTDPSSFQRLSNSSNLITPRGDCRAVAVGGKIFAVGGVFIEGSTNTTRFLSSVEAFDPSTQTWSARAPMHNPRGDFGIEVLTGNRIVVAGGEKGDAVLNPFRTQIAMHEVEEYVVADNIWVQKAPLPEARFRDDLATVGNRVYVFGGNPTCEYDGDAKCFKIALNTVFVLFDVEYPRLYAFYKPTSN